MQAPSVLPFWLVAPLAAITMIIVAGHLLAMRAARDSIPHSRYRIRSTNAAIMLTLAPLLACAFGVVSPDEEKLFVLTWLTCVGLMAIVVALAIADGINNIRICKQAIEELRDEHRDLMSTIQRELKSQRDHNDEHA